MRELSIRENCSIKSLLEDKGFVNVLLDKKSTSSQKCAKFLKILREMRYPIFMEADRCFKELKKKLKLPSNVSFEHSPYFENPDYEVLMKVSSAEQSVNTLKKLLDITSRKEYLEIYQIDEKLKGEVEK